LNEGTFGSEIIQNLKSEASQSEQVHSLEADGSDFELSNEKNQFLSLLETRYSLVGDGAGFGIEAGIKPVVIMLNALGFITTASCEGHADGWSKGVPWVALELAENLPMITTSEEAEERERGLATLHIRILELLKSFYRERRVNYESMLRPSEQAFSIHISAIATEAFNALPEDERLAQLPAHQEEMHAFADFLKTTFAQGDNPAPAQIEAVEESIRKLSEPDADLTPTELEALKIWADLFENLTYTGDPVIDTQNYIRVSNQPTLTEVIGDWTVLVQELTKLKHGLRETIIHGPEPDWSAFERGEIRYVAPVFLSKTTELLNVLSRFNTTNT